MSWPHTPPDFWNIYGSHFTYRTYNSEHIFLCLHVYLYIFHKYFYFLKRKLQTQKSSSKETKYINQPLGELRLKKRINKYDLTLASNVFLTQSSWNTCCCTKCCEYCSSMNNVSPSFRVFNVNPIINLWVLHSSSLCQESLFNYNSVWDW